MCRCVSIRRSPPFSLDTVETRQYERTSGATTVYTRSSRPICRHPQGAGETCPLKIAGCGEVDYARRHGVVASTQGPQREFHARDGPESQSETNRNIDPVCAVLQDQGTAIYPYHGNGQPTIGREERLFFDLSARIDGVTLVGSRKAFTRFTIIHFPKYRSDAIAAPDEVIDCPLEPKGWNHSHRQGRGLRRIFAVNPLQDQY